MKVDFKQLQELQNILSERYNAESKLDSLPRTLETNREILERLTQTYMEKVENRDKIKKQLAKLNIEMEDAVKHRAESEQKMSEINTQREYEALDKEIKDATEKEQSIRREIQREQKIFTKIEEEIEWDESMIASQKEELASDEENIKKSAEELKKVIDQIQIKENEIAPLFDEALLFKFGRIIKHKSGEGIVPISNGICSGCQMILPGQFVNDIRKGESIEFCPYCSRILYYEGALIEEGSSEEESGDEGLVGALSDLVADDDLLD